MNIDQLNGFINFLTQVRDNAGKVFDKEKELQDLKEENEKLKTKIKEYDDLDFNPPDTDEVILSGGTLYVNLDGLDYMTQQSFKEWCMKHAITNSEPVFNL